VLAAACDSYQANPAGSGSERGTQQQPQQALPRASPVAAGSGGSGSGGGGGGGAPPPGWLAPPSPAGAACLTRAGAGGKSMDREGAAGDAGRCTLDDGSLMTREQVR
jgi:hypothetical protein